MAHNITDTDGLVLFRDAAWHGMGTVVQEDISPNMALKVAGLDWDVELVKNPSVTDSLGRVCTSDRHQSIIRMDTGKMLGIHGMSYQPVQNEDLFEMAYALGGQVKVETAGSLAEGRKLFLLLRGDTLKLKRNDEAHPYLALTNSHDGTAKLAAVPTSVRVVCQNTLSLMFQKSGSRMHTITHNGSMSSKIKEMQIALKKYQADADTWLQNVTALQDKPLKQSELIAFWGKVYSHLWGQPKTEAEVEKAALTLGKWEATMETERASLAYNDVDVWLAANAVTQDIQHSDPLRRKEGWQERRMESNWFGKNTQKTASVFQLALEALS